MTSFKLSCRAVRGAAADGKRETFAIKAHIMLKSGSFRMWCNALVWLLKNVVYRLICGSVDIQVSDIIYDSRKRCVWVSFCLFKGICPGWT